jgi:hypothetical protein
MPSKQEMYANAQENVYDQRAAKGTSTCITQQTFGCWRSFHFRGGRCHVIERPSQVQLVLVGHLE